MVLLCSFLWYRIWNILDVKEILDVIEILDVKETLDVIEILDAIEILDVIVLRGRQIYQIIDVYGIRPFFCV